MEEIGAIGSIAVGFGRILIYSIFGIALLVLFLVIWMCFKEAVCGAIKTWYARNFSSAKKGSS